MKGLKIKGHVRATWRPDINMMEYWYEYTPACVLYIGSSRVVNGVFKKTLLLSNFLKYGIQKGITVFKP